MQSKNHVYNGLVFRCLSPTIKRSRGKYYPSLDIRRFDVYDIRNKASMYHLCPVWCYEYKKHTYIIEIKKEHENRTTISCREGLPFTKEVIDHVLKAWRE